MRKSVGKFFPGAIKHHHVSNESFTLAKYSYFGKTTILFGVEVNKSQENGYLPFRRILLFP